MPSKALVIDANILVRAVLGRRVREVIETYAGQVSFFVPEVAYAEAGEHLPVLVGKHGGDPVKALRFLRSLIGLVELIGSEVYGDFERDARERLGERDPDDWPILASALAIGCQSGQKTPTSSGAEYRHGLPAASPCFCATLRNRRECIGIESGRPRVGPADPTCTRGSESPKCPRSVRAVRGRNPSSTAGRPSFRGSPRE